MSAVWVSGARNAVQLFQLKDPLTGLVIDDAAVTAKLIDPDNGNADIANSSFSVPLLDGASGRYGARSTILSLALGKNYIVDIQAVQNGSIILWDWIPVVAGKGSGN